MTWFHLDSGRCAAPLNMALDEALLELAPELCAPVLRFCGWTERAATFGYFQRFAEVEKLTVLRPLIRRPTGGGIVPHDADWTYSLAFPAGHEWHGLKAEESYRRIHDWLRQAFGRMEVETELAPCCRPGAGQCFVGYEKSDLLWRGRKVAGAAQRRTKTGLLIQGSVQPPPLNLRRDEWQQAMLAAATEQWGVRWLELPVGQAPCLPPFRPGTSAEPSAASSTEVSRTPCPTRLAAAGQRILELAAVLQATKYSQDDFNRKR